MVAAFEYWRKFQRQKRKIVRQYGKLENVNSLLVSWFIQMGKSLQEGLGGSRNDDICDFTVGFQGNYRL